MHRDVGVALGAQRAELEPRAFEGWRARLALELAYEGTRGTRVRRALHEGPLRVQRPFHPEGADGPCHVYVLHPPGGVVASDVLELEVELREQAHALLTTPGASKLYRARAPHLCAQVSQRFVLADGATLEWFPQETIVFDGAEARTETRVELAARATYAGWEIVCLGRPAAHELFTRGELRTKLALTRAGELAYYEPGRFRGGDTLLSARWGLAGEPVLGLFVVASPHAERAWVEALRGALVTDEGLVSVTLVSGVLLLRFLGGSTRSARALFERALAVLRPLYAGRAAVHPRIWST